MTFYDDIPDDPELAFLHLEKLFREDCAKGLKESAFKSSTEDYLRYISRTLGGANRA